MSEVPLYRVTRNPGRTDLALPPRVLPYIWDVSNGFLHPARNFSSYHAPNQPVCPHRAERSLPPWRQHQGTWHLPNVDTI